MRRFVGVWTTALLIALLPSLAMGGDREISQQIAGQIKESGRLKDYTIGVQFTDGIAVLQGSVRDAAQAAAAVEVTQSSPSVTRVVNNLEISPAGEAPTLRPSTAATHPTARMVDPYRANPVPVAAAAVPQIRQVAAEEPSLGQPTVASAGLVAAVAAPAQQPRLRAAAVPVAMVAQHAQYAQRGQPMPAQMSAMQAGGPMPSYVPGQGGSVAPVRYDHPHMPNYAWPAYASHPNYSALTYPKQYSPTAWPYIGPFYPYPQVPLGWRKVTLEWDDGWWMLDFKQ